MSASGDSAHTNPLSDAELERALFDAMRVRGDLPPSTSEEVARLEAELDIKSKPLPDSLRTASAALAHARRRAKCLVIPFPAVAEAQENLARAARDGGELAKTTEERMKQDREAAEDEQERS